jgi:multicomponent Na+:H+ antiporter subunit G
MVELWAGALALAGALVMLVAALGILTLPDFYMRMQAATKASALGITLVMIALGVAFAAWGLWIRALLVVGFLFLTLPVSAHLLGRAAFTTGVPLYETTRIDPVAAAALHRAVQEELDEDPNEGDTSPRGPSDGI